MTAIPDRIAVARELLTRLPEEEVEGFRGKQLAGIIRYLRKKQKRIELSKIILPEEKLD